MLYLLEARGMQLRHNVSHDTPSFTFRAKDDDEVVLMAPLNVQRTFYEPYLPRPRTRAENKPKSSTTAAGYMVPTRSRTPEGDCFE